LPVLPPPYNILELAHEEEFEFVPDAYVIGRMLIHPRWPGAPPAKWIKAIRVHLREPIPAYGPPFVDITPSLLAAQLEPLLTVPDFRAKRYKIKAFGKAPKKRFRIEVSPLGSRV